MAIRQNPEADAGTDRRLVPARLAISNVELIALLNLLLGTRQLLQPLEDIVWQKFIAVPGLAVDLIQFQGEFGFVFRLVG